MLILIGGNFNVFSQEEKALVFYQDAARLFATNSLVIESQVNTLMRLKRRDAAFSVWARLLRFGNPRQIERAKSKMFQYYPRVQVEAAMREAAKLR